MFTPLFAARRLLQYKLEATAYVAETLADTDAAFYADSPSMDFSDGTQAREDIGATGGWAKGTPIAMSATAKAGIRFYGSGGTGLPAWADLLQACRFKKGTGGTANVYTLTNEPSEWITATVKTWIGGKRFRLARGCMGDLEMVFTAGRNLVLNPSLIGAAVSQDDGTVPTGVTITGATPAIFGGGASMTINSLTDLGIQTATLKLNNATAIREGQYGTGELGEGYAGGLHSPGKPTFEIDPEATAASDVDWVQLMRDGTLFDATLVVGSALGNKLTVVLEDLQVTNPPGQGERDKKNIDNVMMEVLGGITLTFAPTTS
jgi:hypothetical protein